ncbi:efflux RND transporter periplasmic adaptor subunit [Pseudoalteromonas sp. S16_S37]|uniref:efflux RND transporter periplasmic adaptor subunit n=1 Tax=Pseudoalteromonas sp. S16_S37 TaxID=2720228 RepID=UPI0016807F09|nr:efflux RND transporter periplasmic adaptor subunit [Pseudoalteromonas sp. S16_S37]MBD1582321.1 efflux RND transporter periplasmic adaptor subunit [Pseudoalteromonas sp. S16_S37]
MLKKYKFYYLLGLSLGLMGCMQAQEEVVQSVPKTAVDIVSVPTLSVVDWFTYTTRLESPQQVELRPRVTGLISSVEFKEGDLVQRGDILFKLDKRTFLAQVSELKAQILKAQAALQQAHSESARAQRLRKQKAISAEEAEARTSVTAQREAELAALRASLELAELKVEFTEIRSPITGKISNALFTEGNTVKANETVLTSIVSTDRLYAYFDIDERTWNSHFAAIPKVAQLPVKLQLLGTQQQSQQGVIDFVDNAIDERSGTLRVRATFNNDDKRLLPGAFARISLSTGRNDKKTVVPDRAVGTDLKNRFVLVMDKDNTLQYRKVELGKRYGELRAITGGVELGEWVVMNGPAKVGPGMSVEPREINIELPQSYSNIELAMREEQTDSKER